MNTNFLVAALTIFALPACAPYQPQSLSRQHPAHADAPAAPTPPPSRTLAYSLAVAPRPVFAAAAAEPEAGRQTVTAEGKVIAAVPGAAQLVVEHGEIKGFMDAMTMGYRVDPPSLADGLKFGDRVRFTIDVAKKAIIKVEKIN